VSQKASDRKTRRTVFVALGANLLIVLAKAVGGLFTGSPALLSEAAHSVADSFNEIFLLAALRRSRKPADRQHPFGYGKERFFWSLLAAVGIFVMGGCFSFFQGYDALRSGSQESHSGYLVGLAVLGIALLAEGTSLIRALYQARKDPDTDGIRDPALRTVVAEDGTAVIGVTIAIAGMALHMVTGEVIWEASASFAIGVLLVAVAYWLGKSNRDQLVGEAADPELRREIQTVLEAQPEIDNVETLLTMKLGMDSTLVAARIDLVPGLESEDVELISGRMKNSVMEAMSGEGQVFLDITEAPPGRRTEANPGPALTVDG